MSNGEVSLLSVPGGSGSGAGAYGEFTKPHSEEYFKQLREGKITHERIDDTDLSPEMKFNLKAGLPNKPMNPQQETRAKFGL